MSDIRTVVFVHGADMAPESLRATWPSAQFIARAQVAAADLPGAIPPGASVSEVWGILISVPGDALPGATITATSDDGRSFTAAPVTRPDAIADPEATVATARYWELPPAYVTALAVVAPVS